MNNKLNNKIDDIISNFENGKERYQKSEMVNAVINSLARGANPFKIIDQLLLANDKIHEEFHEYAKNDTRPFVVSKLHPSITHINASDNMSEKTLQVINNMAEKVSKMTNEEINELAAKNREGENFTCYEIWRPNIPDNGCSEQCKECKSKQSAAERNDG